MAIRQIQGEDALSPLAPAEGAEFLISTGSTLPPPIGTGCMACCSGGVDPTWGGVVTASSVAI